MIGSTSISLFKKFFVGLTLIFSSASLVRCDAPSIKNADFSNKGEQARTRILLYGDAGAGDDGQRAVGQSMLHRHREKRFDFALSVGDNQYIDGNDIFKKIFEIPYAALILDGLLFYQTPGNHDMENNRIPAQLEYSRKVDAVNQHKGGWVLPAQDYIIDRGYLRVVVFNPSTANVDVNLTPERMNFLRNSLCDRLHPVTILSLHYPLWSTGIHGDTTKLHSRILPILKECKTKIVVSGHDHQGEYFEPWEGIQFIISGNGHENRTARQPSAGKSLYRDDAIGFAELDLDISSGCVRFLNVANERSEVKKEFCFNFGSS